MHLFSRWSLALLSFLLLPAPHAEWQFDSTGDSEHQRLRISKDDRPVAEFVYGTAEMKPFLHVYGRDGNKLTEWSPGQQFPHHRGIFIGWNRIRSDLGRYDLWHMNNGGKMKVAKILEQGTTPEDRAFFEAEIKWHAGKEDENGSSLLLREVRRFEIASDEPGEALIDVSFLLTAARDLHLDGDLQHSGIHFRGSKELVEREKETSYIWEPPLPGPGGKVVSDDLKWCRLFFPIGDQWYSATQLNAPSNPVEELSWRAYGRFGFFFTKQLSQDESLEIHYRFITTPEEAPQGKKFSDEELEPARAETAKLHQKYVKSLD